MPKCSCQPCIHYIVNALVCIGKNEKLTLLVCEVDGSMSLSSQKDGLGIFEERVPKDDNGNFGRVITEEIYIQPTLTQNSYKVSFRHLTCPFTVRYRMCVRTIQAFHQKSEVTSRQVERRCDTASAHRPTNLCFDSQVRCLTQGLPYLALF